MQWSITEKFSDNLKLHRFLVLTDNNPLTYVLASAKLDATTQRWIAALSSYDFEIKYRSGINNADADTMSRLPELLQKGTLCSKISSESIEAICNAIPPIPAIETVSCSSDTLNNLDTESSTIQQLNIPYIQNHDRILSFWVDMVQTGSKPFKDHIPNTAILNIFDKLQIINNCLYRSTTDTVSGETRKQFLIPTTFRKFILQKIHNEMGHQERDRTISLLRDRFYWHGMTKYVESWISNCDRCLRRKTSTKQRAPNVSIETSQPLELVCMNFLGLETSKGGQQYILVITDHFTKYAIAVPTKNTTARTTAEAFMNNFVVQYGFQQNFTKYVRDT